MLARTAARLRRAPAALQFRTSIPANERAFAVSPAFYSCPVVVAQSSQLDNPTVARYSSASNSDSSISNVDYSGYTTLAWLGILEAVNAARESKTQIDTKILLKALLDQKNGRAQKIFTKAGLDETLMQSTYNLVSYHQAKTKVTDVIPPHMMSLLQNARRFKEDMGDSFVAVEHLVLAFTLDKNVGEQLFKYLQLSEESLMEAVKSVRQNKKITSQDAEDEDEEVRDPVIRIGAEKRQSSQDSDDNQDALSKYGNDLTELASHGKLDPVIGRDAEIRRCIHILCRRRKNNPIIIGEPGVGKTAIVEGLAQRIICDDVPEPLLHCRLISLDIGAILAGAKFRGDFEERFKAVMNEVTASQGQIILFIDEIHMVVGAGSTDGAMDAGNLLKPLLGRGELQCIGATTLNEHRKYIEKDCALARRFQPIYCEENSVEDTISILRGSRERLELYHGVRIKDSSLVSAAILADRYITDRFLPDKAIDLIDEAASRLKMEISSRPIEIEKVESSLLKLSMEYKSMQNERDRGSKARILKLEHEMGALNDVLKGLNEQFEIEKVISSTMKEIARINLETQAAEFENNIDRSSDLKNGGALRTLQHQLEEAEKRLLDYCPSQKLMREEVSDLEILEIVSMWTGIPMSNIQQTEREKLVFLEQVLRKRVIGQDAAVKSVADAIRRSKVGVSDPNRPVGSFLFMGPTGVGKTELAKALAGCLFSTENALVRIDMSEYMDKGSASRLIGAPPGYIGYEDPGHFEKVRRRPFSIVLFDEIEKACPEVLNLLLQIIDDGRITDSQGRTVNFKNTIVIMTSNVGSHVIVSNLRNAARNEEGEETIRRHVLELARHTFRPEFMNRIDEYIIFRPLDFNEVREIAKIELNRLKDRIGHKKMEFFYTEEALALLAHQGFDPSFGARPIGRVIQQQIGNFIAKGIFKGDFSEGDSITLDAGPGSQEDGPKTFKVYAK